MMEIREMIMSYFAGTMEDMGIRPGLFLLMTFEISRNELLCKVNWAWSMRKDPSKKNTRKI